MATTTKNIFRNQVREYVMEHINYSIPELVEAFKRETFYQKMFPFKTASLNG